MSNTSSRALALAALQEWRSSETFADAILSRRLRASELMPADRGFATELFYGVIRNIALLDFWIASLRPVNLDPDARDILRLGLYQLFFLETPEHAAVFETVALASTRLRSLVNAILRNALRQKELLLARAGQQDLSIRSSHPQFLIQRWAHNFGEKNAAALCEWNNLPAPIYARVNLLKTSLENFVSRHPEVEALPENANFMRLKSIPGEALAAGHCYIQDPSTALACRLLDPKPGERVLDACAAPGGKTGLLAELMRNQGAIVACDRDAGRIQTLQDNLDRLGVGVVRVAQHDWTTGQALPEPWVTCPFDRILIDAPCSNTGVMRRRVDLRWRLSPKDFSRMPHEQLRIVRAIIPLLKAGGALVYSTCSIEPEENEKVIDAILREFSFLQLTEQRSLLPFRDGFDGAYAGKLVRAE
ncbi:MAG TPA: 16S rRNA (cytosine(967)-C(5))-methyltransferase RsmB [Chthoniobacterales bacterium]|nr:16S rRNA (cytosine(967)-C(5))-methyltransferase RsmB [Chthoniobacterales bacterium]